ncbi:MAG: polysaccharide biosynthesis protein [Propionibacteriaceae bacterium]
MIKPATERRIEGSQLTITGGTGSFGRTMVQHLLARDVRQINIFSRDEAKQDLMRRELNDERLRFFIGDVRDRDSIEAAMIGTDFVFHAAALKQVPSCEFFPVQAVKTNVLGSANVLDVASKAGVRGLVCLSTDKAVYPINAMGQSKALMESTVRAWARNNPQSQMTTSVTRYGNVLYSRGSVLPYFVDQLANGKPMTLTEPTMTRFHMTLAQSVELVEYAWLNAIPGDLFVMKAPASTIQILAEALAKVLNKPAETKVIGIRHGEKMHEALLSAEDLAKAEDRGNFFRVPLDDRSLDYDKYFSEGTPQIPSEGFTSANAPQLDVDGVAAILRTLPEIKAML